MRVLHLLDAASPQASSTTLALLAESCGRLGHIQQRVLLLGPARLRRAARRVGVADAESLNVPFSRVPLGWFGLRRRVGQMGAFDLIHGWSIGAFTFACLAWPGVPRALSLTVSPGARAVQWLRLLTGHGAAPAALLPISNTLRRELLGGGVAAPLVHVLRPGLDLGRVAHAARASLRAGWGVEAPRYRVVALLGDPPWASDCRAAAMAVGLADEVVQARATNTATARLADNGSELRLLVHPRQPHRAAAEAMSRHLGRPLRIVQEPRLVRPWEVLPGCDAALAAGPGGGGLSLLWAMCANVPIVAEATYAISEVLEDRHSALLARPREPKGLAHRLTQLLRDPQLAWKLRDTARHEAYSFFSRQHYVQSVQALYEQLAADRPIELPAMAASGGLRFTART